MTLERLLYKITQLAIAQNGINYAAAGGSIYDLNPRTIKDYPLFFASPTGNHNADGQTIAYSLTFFYLDRLMEDNGNDISIFSAGISQLKNIIKGLEEDEDILAISGDLSYANFTETEKMSDRCAGAYVTLSVTVPYGGCYE